jgi:hypothetical protein
VLALSICASSPSHCLSLAYLPCVNVSTCVCTWMNACACVCVNLFVCVSVSVCSGILGQQLHYGAHDFFPEKHASPFFKSASSSDRQLAVSPAVCMSVHVCIRDLCRSVCACMCVCTDIPKVTPTCSRPCFPYPHFPHHHSSTLAHATCAQTRRGVEAEKDMFLSVVVQRDYAHDAQRSGCSTQSLNEP